MGWVKQCVMEKGASASFFLFAAARACSYLVLMSKFVEQHRWTTSLRVIPHHVDFIVSCQACGYRRPIGRADLQAIAGDEDDLERIDERLRCSSCQAREGRVLVGYYA